MFLNRSQVKNNYKFLVPVLVFFAFSCKKSTGLEEGRPSFSNESNLLQTFTTDRDLLTKDSIFLYAKQTYLWNEGMPSYDDFNPRSYSSNIALVNAIRNLEANKGRDKYSFVDDGSLATQITGEGKDYGFSVQFDSNSQLRIRFVYPNSPADNFGLERGDIITQINGSKNIDKTDIGISYIVDGIFGNYNSIALTIKKQDGTHIEMTIPKNNYTINPVLSQEIFNVGNKNVGYLVYNSFTTNSLSYLDQAFENFSRANIQELIVDLRYNGGGVISTAEALTNLIAPSSQNGRVMYTNFWTKTMQEGNATILNSQKFFQRDQNGNVQQFSFFDYSYEPTVEAGNVVLFAKRGNVNNLKRVYFLVTSASASASELVINNLKAVMDVKLLGKRTYGKPVGFFGLRINKSDLYIPQFQSKNQLNQGDYFNGFMVDNDVADDITKNFGHPDEQMLNHAFYHIENNTFKPLQNNNRLASVSGSVNHNNSLVNAKFDTQIKGMIETRKFKLK